MKKAPEEPKPLSFATPNPWSALPREVYVGKGRGKKEGATTESPVDGQDQPKIYTIRDHTLKVLMHPDVLELHAVRVVHTPHGDERQLHLKVRVRCGQEELVVDVLVGTGAQVSLVRRRLFKEESLQPSCRPVRLKVANGEIMGGKEGPYQDRAPLCPFRLLPLLIYSGSTIAFLKFQGPKSKNIENTILLQP